MGSYADCFPPGCIGAWDLQDGDSIMRRTAGYADNGSYSGGVTFTENGPGPLLPKAVTFDGVNGYGQFTLPAPSAAATVQTWTIWAYSPVDITTATANTGVISTTSASPVYTPLALGSSTGLLASEVVGTYSEALGASDRTAWRSITVPAGWAHYCMTFSGSQNGWTLYVNGILRSDKIASSGGSGGFNSSLTYLLGSIANASYYNITVAGLAVFQTEWTESLAQRLYRAGRGGFHVGSGPRNFVG